MIQKTIILETMINGMTLSGEPCKSINDQVNELMRKNPHYVLDGVVDIPTKYQNTEKALMIVSMLEECVWNRYDDGQMGIHDWVYSTKCGRDNIDEDSGAVAGDYCPFCGRKKKFK